VEIDRKVCLYAPFGLDSALIARVRAMFRVWAAAAFCFYVASRVRDCAGWVAKTPRIPNSAQRLRPAPAPERRRRHQDMETRRHAARVGRALGARQTSHYILACPVFMTRDGVSTVTLTTGYLWFAPAATQSAPTPGGLRSAAEMSPAAPTTLSQPVSRPQ
jgi:hypothetical protein